MVDYASTAKKFAASEERLFGLLDEFKRVRLKCREGNFQDKALAEQAEKLFDEADKERKIAQALFDKLREMHESFWKEELDRQLYLAREALARAHRVASRVLGATGHFQSWVSGKFNDELIVEIISRIERDRHEIPLDPPRSFALDVRAHDELRTN